MTERRYKKLSQTREIMSMLGWLLMVLNLLVGMAIIVSAIITRSSLLDFGRSLTVMFVISMTIGVLAVLDMSIYRRIRSSKVIDT